LAEIWSEKSYHEFLPLHWVHLNLFCHPIRETIHLGGTNDSLVFQATYDPAFGTVTASRDFNDIETTYGYDPLARLTNIVRPGDTLAFPTVEYTYAPPFVPLAPSGERDRVRGS
jgi:YD repeat-containing protein